jgi:EmrB/QacA subfamily drug resistance transporter
MSHGSHPHEVAEPAAAPPDSRRWAALTLLSLAQLMLIVDITVVQVALPTIGDDLGLDRESLTWIVTTYTLAFGGLMVFGGRLADSFGAWRIFFVGLAVFTTGSLLCGLASDGAVLIAGRAAQGVGAALMSPSALSIITTSFHGAERNRALGVWAAIGGSGAAIGVLVSGALTAGPGWEWVFFVNVPIGIAVAVTIPTLVRADRFRADRGGLDIPGAVTVSTASGLLIYGLVNAGEAGWGATETLATLAAAALVYAGFVAIERRARSPLMSAATMVRRPVLSGTFVMLIATGLMLGLFFLTTLYLQHVLDYSALRTGLLFLPVAVAITAGAHLASQLISRIGGRPVAAVGFALTAIGAGLLTQVEAGDSAYVSVLPGFVVAAFGLGPAFVTATATTLANVPHKEAGVASGVINTFHELGGSVGVAVLSTVAAGSISASATSMSGFVDGYLVAALAAAAAALVVAALIPPGRPDGAVGHGH